MNWLLWKEYRQNRLIVFVTLAILIVPHLIAIYASWKEMNAGHRHGAAPWVTNFTVSGMYGLVLAQVALALIGGNVIAGERVDRSAEFQAYLPIPRSKILAAKILLSLAIAAVIWLPNGTLLLALVYERGLFGGRPDLLQVVATIATTGLAFFCIAWFFSSILRSATFSVCAGLLAAPFLMATFLFITYLFGIEPDPLVKPFYFSTCLTVSPVCFGMGAWLYLRRVEP
jgi:ABC-type transport system involved in multi-copper enzyme maturation permease subunit